MEIVEQTRVKNIPRETIISAGIKKKSHHDAHCNGHSSPGPKYYRYVQPKVAESFAPVRFYKKPTVALDNRTTYKLSFWPNPAEVVKPIQPEHSLKLDKCRFHDETTNKLSYLGNWCVKPEQPIIPCKRQWLGKDPIQSDTTQKRDFTWKNIDPTKPIKARPHLHPSREAMENNTTYKLSYFDSVCVDRVKSFRPIGEYVKSDVPMEGSTTYNLSYWPNQITREDYPWGKPAKYKKPSVKLDSSTTYNLSFWPHCEKRVEPIVRPAHENLLNAGRTFENCTTYKLSYFGSEGGRMPPIKPPDNIELSHCPFAYDTVNKMSYLGNWCVKPESAIKPCRRNWGNVGPMQKDTTQKCDFAWKYEAPTQKIIPSNHIKCSEKPFESHTTQKLSFMPTNLNCMLPTKSFAPVKKYERSDVPIESNTVQRLSYQPVGNIEKVEVTWGKNVPYRRPTTSMEDNTTYNLSYILPGTLIPVS